MFPFHHYYLLPQFIEFTAIQFLFFMALFYSLFFMDDNVLLVSVLFHEELIFIYFLEESKAFHLNLLKTIFYLTCAFQLGLSTV